MRVGKRWAREGDKTTGERNEWEKGNRVLLFLFSFSQPPHSLPTLLTGGGGPRREPEIDRFIWIGKVDPPHPEKKKLVSFQSKWQMSLSICYLQSGVHNAPPQRMMDFIMAGSPRFTVAARRQTDSSRGRRTPTTAGYCCYVKHSDALLCST